MAGLKGTMVDPSALPCHAYLPGEQAALPPIVLVHGAARRALEQFRTFIPFAAEADRVLLAPDFGDDRFVGFQQLAGREGSLSAANEFHRAISETAARLAVSGDQVDLIGFSGGAQFAHRYAMLFPELVRRLVVVSAGWFTYLDAERPFPRGIGQSPATAGQTVDVEAFLRVPMRVMVGEKDLIRDPLLRTSPRMDRRQGFNRVVRANRWVQHLQAEASARGLRADVSLELLPDTAHSFRQAIARGGLGERALGFLSHASTVDTHSAATKA
jgi:pimeloyl-ACP methyl ester carboxylesterase